jgi:hypothetical protein
MSQRINLIDLHCIEDAQHVADVINYDELEGKFELWLSAQHMPRCLETLKVLASEIDTFAWLAERVSIHVDIACEKFSATGYSLLNLLECDIKTALGEYYALYRPDVTCHDLTAVRKELTLRIEEYAEIRQRLGKAHAEGDTFEILLLETEYNAEYADLYRLIAQRRQVDGRRATLEAEVSGGDTTPTISEREAMVEAMGVLEQENILAMAKYGEVKQLLANAYAKGDNEEVEQVKECYEAELADSARLIAHNKAIRERCAAHQAEVWCEAATFVEREIEARAKVLAQAAESVAVVKARIYRRKRAYTAKTNVLLVLAMAPILHCLLSTITSKRSGDEPRCFSITKYASGHRWRSPPVV